MKLRTIALILAAALCLSLAACVKDALPGLKECKDYGSFYSFVEKEIRKEADRICAEKEKEIMSV